MLSAPISIRDVRSSLLPRRLFLFLGEIPSVRQQLKESCLFTWCFIRRHHFVLQSSRVECTRLALPCSLNVVTTTASDDFLSSKKFYDNLFVNMTTTSSLINILRFTLSFFAFNYLFINSDRCTMAGGKNQRRQS